MICRDESGSLVFGLKNFNFKSFFFFDDRFLRCSHLLFRIVFLFSQFNGSFWQDLSFRFSASVDYDDQNHNDYIVASVHKMDSGIARPKIKARFGLESVSVTVAVTVVERVETPSMVPVFTAFDKSLWA